MKRLIYSGHYTKKISLLLVISFLVMGSFGFSAFSNQVVQAATVNFVDNVFDATANGSIPPGWTKLVSGGTIGVAEYPSATNKSLKVVDTSSTLDVGATAAFEDYSGILTAEARILVPAKQDFLSIALMSGANTAIRVGTALDGSLCYKNSSDAHISLQTYNVNTWYDIKIVANVATDKCDIFVNNVKKASQVAFNNNVAFINAFTVDTTSAGTGTIYVDSVKVYGDVAVQSSANDIVSFVAPGQIGASIIDTVSHKVTFDMSGGEDIENIAPIIGVSPKATINPPSGTRLNFTLDQTFIVTAENGSTQNWIVECIVNDGSLPNGFNLPSMNEITIKDTNYTIPPSNPAYDIFYVTPAGSTNADGTINKPYTIKEAVAAARPGSYIIIRAGTYREFGIAIDKKLTLQPYPHEEAWFKGSTIVSNWQPAGSIHKSTGWTTEFDFPGNAEKELKDAPAAASLVDMVFINGNSMQQVTTKTQVTPGSKTFYVDYANDELYISEAPSGMIVEATSYKNAMDIKAGTDGVQIKGLGFAHYAYNALSGAGQQFLIENCTIAWNAYRGMYFYSAADSILRGNKVIANGSVGIAFNHANNSIVENNEISYNNIERFATTWAAAGFKTTTSFKLTIRNNDVHHNLSTAIWTDINCIFLLVHDNKVYQNKNIGIFFELGHGCTAAFNTVYENGNGIQSSDSSESTIINNTLVNNKKNVRVSDSPRKYDPNVTNEGNTPEAKLYSTWETAGTIVKNNLFVDPAITTFNAPDDYQDNASSTFFTAINYNGYYKSPQATSAASLFEWQKVAGGATIVYTTLADFKADNSAYEVNGKSFGSTAIMFVSRSNYDLRLLPGSGAIAAGTKLPADLAAKIGRSSTVNMNLGALPVKPN